MSDEGIPPSIRQKSDEELRQLALDTVEDRVFTSLHVEPGEIVHVFMLIVLMLPEERKEYLADCAVLYEYLDKASPRAINGLPNFLSVNKLGFADFERWRDFYREASAA